MSGVGNSMGSAQFGERIVHAFLNEHMHEVQALGQETIQFLNELLTSLCQRANEEAAALIAETVDNQNDGEQLHGRLEELGLKLQAAENENIQLKEALQEMTTELVQTQTQYEIELLACKEEIDRLRADLQQSAIQQQKLQQLFREDQIKFREINQQKQLLAHVATKESHRRHLLESELQKVQGQLVQLSFKFQTLERSHDELSQSLQSKEERIRYLNSIIEESQYVSSFSPHSNPRINDLPEQENSFASQQLVRTLRDQQLPLIRLSQSQLPAEQSLQSSSAVSIEEPQPQLLAVPKSDRTLVASESKAKKHTKAIVLSQQKATKDEGSLRKDPEKSKTAKQETKTIALSKQDPKAVKSKLTSIFRDRLTYKSEHDQIHQDTINRLKYRLREREQQIQNLNRQVSLLRVVRAEPVVVSSSSREGKREVQQLRAENESLRRITKEITMRKQYLQTQVEEFKERCAYYKSEHKKVYQQYLLKNAESVAYSEQLSEIEISHYRQRQEISMAGNEEAEEEGFLKVVPIQEPKDEFEDLSSKFNNLVLKHSHTAFNNELQEPSFKSAQGKDPRDFYTIQNIHITDISANDRTLQHDRKHPIKQCEKDSSPAKAVLNEDPHMQDLILEGIQEIALREQPAGEIQTERLILSQLMQTSRRENTLTQFQILFSEHPAKPLQLVSLGCLVTLRQREKVMKIMTTQSISIYPQKNFLTIAQYQAYTRFPKEKTSVCVGDHTQSNDIDTQTRMAEVADYPCQAYPEGVDFQQQFIPSLKEISTTTDLISMKQAQTSTLSSETAETGMGSNHTGTLEQSVNTHSAQITQASINTDQPKISYSSMQTDTRHMTEMHAITDPPTIQQMIDQGTVFDISINKQQTNSDTKSSIDASTSHQSRHLELSPQTSSIFYVPNTAPSNLNLQSDVFQHKIFKTSGKLQLDLSFLNSQRSQIKEKPPSDDEQLTIAQKPQLLHSNVAISAQISSSRTRCSSQDTYSNRSGHPQKPRPNKRPMRESIISQHSEGSDQPNKTEHHLCISKNNTAPTASNTPFLSKQETILAESRMMMEGEAAEPEMQMEKETEKTKEESKIMEYEQVKRGPACDDQQMKIIKDYFYRMKRVENCHTADFGLKHEQGYNFEKNLYILETLREERQELFAIWNGRVIHFGKKIEKMQLGSPHSNCQWPSGNINMGNSEFRILGSKLQVCRREKQRLFKGEMENGEWHIHSVWVWSSN